VEFQNDFFFYVDHFSPSFLNQKWQFQEFIPLMPCPSTGPKMFCASPNFLGQCKNIFVFSASSKTFVAAQKTNLLNGNHLLVWQKMFGTGTKCIPVFETCRRTRHYRINEF
jgi:hypothetical protein